MAQDPFDVVDRLMREWNVETRVDQALNATTIEHLRAQNFALIQIMAQTWRVLQDFRDRLHVLDGRTTEESPY